MFEPTYDNLKKFNSKRINTLKYKLSKVRRQKKELWDRVARLDQENRDLKLQLQVHETKPIVFKFDYEKGLVTCDTNKGHRFQDYNKVVKYSIEYTTGNVNRVTGLTINSSKVQQG